MSNKRHKPEEIVAKLRRVEVLVGQGMPPKIGEIVDDQADLQRGRNAHNQRAAIAI